MAIFDTLGKIVRSAFFEVSWWKKLLLFLSAGLLISGALGAFVVGTGDTGEPWPLAAVRSGAGCILGFLAGATFRLFLKLGLLIGVVVGLGLWGISSLGWIDLPFGSLGELQAAIADTIKVQGQNLNDLMTGYLPSGAMTGAGLFSGATQSPDTNPDDGR